MIIKKLFGVVIIGVMLFNPHLSVSAQQASLNTLVDEALNNNPQIQAAKQRYEAARARIALFREVSDPTVEYEYDKISPESAGGQKVRPMKTLGVSQMIPFPTKIFLRSKVAQKEAKAFEEQYKQTQQTLVKDVKEAYSRLFLSRRKVLFIKDSQRLLEQLVQVIQRKYAANQVGQQDVLRAQVEHSKLSNKVFLFEQEAKIAESRLRYLLGRSDALPIEISENEPMGDLGLTEETAVGLAIKHRPELKSMRETLAKSEAEKALSQQGYLPDITLRYERAMKDGKMSGLRDGEWAGMVGFSVPLWFGSKQASQVREARANFQAAKADYAAFENVTIFEVRSAYAQYATARNLVKVYESGILPQANAAVTSARRSYEAGQTTFFEFLDSLRMQRELQMEYFETIAEGQIALADLLQCCGISLEDLEREIP